MTLTFYTNPMSRGQIARWALEEAGAAYDEVIVPYGPEMKSAEYLAINPMGKVPAIVHNRQVVTECAAICAYLADAFPQAGLAPTPAERAAYYRWLFFAAGPVEAAVTNKAMKVDPEGDLRRMSGYGHYDLVVDVLDKHLSANEYFAGERFTAADIYAGSQIAWGVQFGTLTARDSFHAYIARITQRDAYNRAKARDMALMPQREGAGG